MPPAVVTILRRRDAEQVVVAVGCVREHVIHRETLVRLVLCPRVRDLEWMSGRRHVGQVELRDLRDGLEDRRQLLPEALDLVLAQLEAREPRHVQHLVPRDPRHLADPPRDCAGLAGPTRTCPSTTRGPLSEPSRKPGSERPYSAWTFAACKPLSPCTTSNETR